MLDAHNTDAMVRAILAALGLYRAPDAFARHVLNAMRRDASWNAAMLQYVEAYREAASRAEVRAAIR